MRRAVWVFLWFTIVASPALAQTLDFDATVTFYGDNTEFSNPFREGETLLGTWASALVEARLNERFALRAGIFGNERFGSRDSFDQVRPVLSLVIGGPGSRLILGTLETVRRLDGAGPDRIGPHGLLPPIQQETLAFERPWEAGMQWALDTPRARQDVWVHWQQVNTSRQREIFDAGVDTRLVLNRALALRTAAHIVHQGGQLGGDAPVADSTAVNAGVEAGGPVGRLDRLSLEGAALVSRYVPDRERTSSALTGFGTFVRIAAENAGWRLHALMWRGDDFVKLEGDPQYSSLRRNGTRYRGLRDYAEAGITRTYDLAPASSLELSVRWHRVENDYEYSFRVLAVAKLRRRIR
jgi:hypothetical protein